MIHWGIYLSYEFQFILLIFVYIIPASILFPLAYQSFKGYIITLLIMVLIPSIVLIGLFFLGASRNGLNFPWTGLFFSSSSMLFLFFCVVLLFKRKREHWIKLFVSFLIGVLTYKGIYL